MSLKTKIIGAIVASALACPPAFAVEGSDGMYYTSAAEGFYASIRARFNTGDKDGQNSSVVRDAGSRFGLQGTGEMSHGLEAFYRYELSVPDVGGSGADGLETAISFVGLRGGFGEIRLGKWDLVEHDWVTARTDFTNNGNRPGTWNLDNDQTIQYKSPDFNGLQVGAAFRFDGGNDKTHGKWVCDMDPDMPGVQGGADAPELTPAVGEVGLPDGTTENLEATYQCAAGETLVSQQVNSYDSDLDSWTLAGNYLFSGFNVGAAYSVKPDAWAVDDGRKDSEAWGVSGSYAQDNWTVATFYKKRNDADRGMIDAMKNHEDTSYFSVAGRVNIGKTGVIVTHDTRDNSNGRQDTATTFEVEYHLNSKAKVWVGYTGSDYDSEPTTEDDVYFGLRHDF